MRMAPRAALLVSLLAGLPGCARVAVFYGLPRIQPCDISVPPSTGLRGDLVRRLQVHVESDEVSEGFQIVLQKRGERLTVVGLTRFGATAFTIVQEVDEIEVRSSMGPIAAVPPRNLLIDLHHWPLGTLATPWVKLEVAADGRSATLVNRRCGYRTTIVDTADANH